MKEDLLHYLWQYQEFNKEQLSTSQNELVLVISVGFHNSDAGPDFINVRVKLANVLWSGAVEIHVKSSDWFKHKHHLDPAYNNVILHVVWEDDVTTHRSDGTYVPTLVLKERVDLSIIGRYNQFFKTGYEQGRDILCKSQLPFQDSFTVLSMMENTLVQRVETKAQEILLLLEKNMGDWNVTLYQNLMKGFGFKVNADPFLALGEAVPLSVVLKLGKSLPAFEAVLLGQAGFLDQSFQDDYLNYLREEYQYIAKKFHLDNHKMPVKLWKFSRLRPANFPTLRIVQLAGILHQQAHQLGSFIEETDMEILVKKLSIRQSEYWQTHYYPEHSSRAKLHGIGKESIDNLMINVVVPVKYAFAKFHQDERMTENVFDLLQKLPAEKNKITQQYKASKFPVQSAFDSQAVIELYNKFCSQNRCLYCKIGISVMKKAALPVS